MGARELEIDQDAVRKIEAQRGDSLHVRFGEVWITQHGDPNDYLLKSGDSMTLSGGGVTLATASKPTLLGLYREAPALAHEQVMSEARRAQADNMAALLRKLFRRTPGSTA